MESLILKTLVTSGVWHTAIIVHGREWFFGASGVESCHPGTTMLGQPLKTESLGRTAIDPQTFNDYIAALSRDTFAGHKYDLFKVSRIRIEDVKSRGFLWTFDL